MADEEETYDGPERRSNKERRQGHDRRDMIRFEPTKEERRSGKDRRKMKSVWDDGRSKM